MTLSHRNSKN